MQTGTHEVDQPQTGDPSRKIWSVLIDAWLTLGIVTFFLIRVVGSQTGQRLLHSLGNRHF
jgi:hypothetical protein